MQVQDNSEDSMTFLTELMGRLEADRKTFPELSKEEGHKICHKFALDEFTKGDEEDRGGLADKGTARTFYAAGVFFDMLKQFGELDAETDRRRVYCKWKAAEILKALKEGRTPTPGGLGEEVLTGMPPSGGGTEVEGGVAEITPHYMDEVKSPQGPTASWAPEAPTYTPPVPTAYEPPLPTRGPAVDPTSTPYSHEPAYPTVDARAYDPGVPYAPSAPTPAPTPTPTPTPAPVPSPAPVSSPHPYQPAVAPPQSRPSAPTHFPAHAHGLARHPTPANISDAIEFCRFAIAALEHKEIDLGVQHLQDALRQITSSQ
ncbi:unnamed protein product [Choristocarpus tenellus]